MEIILKEDIQNLGYKDDVVTVKNGYARNYLIPQGLAVMAIGSEKKKLAETLRQRAHKEEKIKNEAEEIAKKIQDAYLKIGAKAGSTGKIFGSVNPLQIAEALKEQYGVDVDRKKIFIAGDSIKEVGEYQAKVNLHKDIGVDIKFEVFAE